MAMDEVSFAYPARTATVDKAKRAAAAAAAADGAASSAEVGDGNTGGSSGVTDAGAEEEPVKLGAMLFDRINFGIDLEARIAVVGPNGYGNIKETTTIRAL